MMGQSRNPARVPGARHALPLAACLLLAGCRSRDSPAAAEYPHRPIKVIVPFAAGGGTDVFARLMKNAIERHELLPQPLVIINVGGAAATIGSRRVRDARPDGYTVLILHDAIVMSKYSGKVSYGPEAFEPVAGTAENGLVLAAREDTRFADLTAVVAAAAERPHELTFGCNLGTPTHFVGLLLQRERPGAAFRFVQSGDGAQRFAAVKGGHVALTVFSTEEFLRYQPDGIRALAFFGAQRHPSMPQVPTAAEQGLPVEAGIMHYWWMPKGTPRERAERFAAALREAMQTPAVQRQLARVHSEPTFADRAEVLRRMKRLERRVATVDLRESVGMPNLPAILFTAVMLLAVAAAIRAIRQRAAAPPRQDDEASHRTAVTVATLILTFFYALVLSRDWVDFRVATVVFVVASGITLAHRRRRMALWIVPLALILAFGLHYLFTRVFVTDLP